MKPFKLFSSAILFTFLLLPAVFAGDDIEGWRPVPPEQLAMKTPLVEADADAEAIFWEVWLDNQKRKKLFYAHYVRVKIFTERGRERFSKFDIPFTKGRSVEEVAARVIKPDGTIIELQPSDIFERDILTIGKVKVRAKSFAVPGIEPGVIVEYKYKEILKNDSAHGERLFFQRDIPMQRAVYYIRPYEGMALTYNFHNMPQTNFVQGKDDYFVATMTNVPSFKKEAQMPPEEETRYWVGLAYVSFSSSWGYYGRAWGAGFEKWSEPGKEVKQKAAELTAGAASQDEKLKKIYEFTQKQIRNISYDFSLTDEQRANFKIKDGDDALRRQAGTESDIGNLFAALARAAGFEVYLALGGDRSDNFFDPNKDISISYLHYAGIAVGINGGWTVFNPGVPFLPYGKIRWWEEGVQTMQTSAGDYFWRKTPMSTPGESVAKRTGKFKLLEDGTLEGTVRIEYEGQRAITRRHEEFRNSPAKREENIKEDIKEQISTAEISAFSIENFEDASKPLVYIYKVRVPNYGQRTGKRLFFQPGFFEYGTKPVFSSAKRVHPIYFHYPWSDEDDIEIELPKGFVPESAGSPGDVLEGSKIGGLTINIYIDKNTNLMKYKRKFFFGAGSNLLFPAKTYEPLKFLFDNFHKADMHTITLKQGV